MTTVKDSFDNFIEAVGTIVEITTLRRELVKRVTDELDQRDIKWATKFAEAVLVNETYTKKEVQDGAAICDLFTKTYTSNMDIFDHRTQPYDLWKVGELFFVRKDNEDDMQKISDIVLSNRTAPSHMYIVTVSEGELVAEKVNTLAFIRNRTELVKPIPTIVMKKEEELTTAKLYIDRTVAELNDMQHEAFELMQDYAEQKERHKKAMFIGIKIFGRQDGKTHKTKEGRKFIRMYDPETGDYLGPLIKSDNAKDNFRLFDPEKNEVIGTVCVPMTHEEAHGKKEPVRDIKVNFNKEAWDKLKYEHDTDQSHFKLAGAALFNPDKGVLEVTLENDNDVEQLVDILNNLSELPKDIGEGTKNSAEIFCRVTGKGYMDFNRYGAILWAMSPKDTLNLPFVVDETVRKINLIAELADLDLNVLILVYAIYKAKYEPANYPYGASDVIFDIVDSMLELKKEGMIQ